MYYWIPSVLSSHPISRHAVLLFKLTHYWAGSGRHFLYWERVLAALRAQSIWYFVKMPGSRSDRFTVIRIRTRIVFKLNFVSQTLK